MSNYHDHHHGGKLCTDKRCDLATDEDESKLWLIFRYAYSVREVWGPFVGRSAAVKFHESMEIAGDPREYAFKEIDHVNPVISRKELQEILIECRAEDRVQWAFDIIWRRLGGT